MHKQIIALFFLLFINIIDSSNCKCKNFENNIYQLTITITNFQPFYTLATLLPNGMYYETSNIANGQSVAELGANLQFNIHGGNYECLSGNIIHLISFGYIYKTNEINDLKTNGGIGVHDYHLQFLKNDNRECTGTFTYAIYPTGSNPFDSANSPFLKSSNNSVKCELLYARGFDLD